MSGEYAIAAMRGLAILAAMVAFGGAAFSALLEHGAPKVGRAATTSLVAAACAAFFWADAAAGGGLSADFLRRLVLQTDIAKFWIVHLAIAAIFAAVALSDGKGRAAIVWLSALNLASFSMLGHAIAAAGPEKYLRIALHSLHLLGAGFWLGAIPPLVKALKDDSAGRAEIIGLFTKHATFAVTILVGAGAANLYLIAGRNYGEISPGYARELAVKLSLVALALALAAINRAYLSPRQRYGAVSCLAVIEIALIAIAAAIGVTLAMSPPFRT